MTYYISIYTIKKSGVCEYFFLKNFNIRVLQNIYISNKYYLFIYLFVLLLY